MFCTGWSMPAPGHPWMICNEGMDRHTGIPKPAWNNMTGELHPSRDIYSTPMKRMCNYNLLEEDMHTHAS
jgi:hypothetical protein